MRTRDYETGPGETRSQINSDAQRVAPKPGLNSPGPLATLQRNFGNQALGQLAASGLQGPRLKASAPDFKPTRFASRVSSPVSAPRIQRKCACGGTCASCAEEESETIHRSAASPALRLSAPAIQRAPAAQQKQTSADTANHASEEATLIVEDDAKSIKPGQMHKTQFLAQLRGHVCSTADAVLASVGKSTKSCPYLEQWLAFYGTQSAAHIERALRKYAPEAAHAKKAQDYFSSVDHRVRKAVTIWAKTGKITGVPPDVPLMPKTPGMPAQENAGAGAKEKPGKDHGAAPQKNILQKHRGENSTETADPEEVRESLGPGRALDGGVRSRMESAFGSDFSQVRLHTDGNAGQLSAQMNARAFTLGNDVAFGAGEYQPGTLVGDALIAHELAHVVQQSGAMPSSGSTTHGHSSYAALESDADMSAVGAVTSLWTGAKGKLAEVGKNAPPRLKSGLRLQGCNRTVKQCPPGKSWQVVGEGVGLAVTCTCVWRCLPGGYVSSAPSDYPTMQCDPPGSCPQPTIEVVGDDYKKEEKGEIVKQPQKPVEDPGSKIGFGGHFTPLAEQAMCGCFPLDIEGSQQGTTRTNAPLIPIGVEATDIVGPLADVGAARAGAKARLNPRTGVPDEVKAPEVSNAKPAAEVENAPPPKTAPAPTAPKPITGELGGPKPPGAAPPEHVPPSSGGGAPSGSTVRVVTVSGEVVVVDSNIAISLDRKARGLPLNDAQEMLVAEAKKQGIVVTPKTVDELNQPGKGPVQGAISTTHEVSIPPAERQEIVNELTSKGVGGPKGVNDREVVTQALLAETAPNVTPVFATADNGIVNPLARIGGIEPARLGRYKNVAEYLKYERNTDRFEVIVRGRKLTVRPVQPVREGLK